MFKHSVKWLSILAFVIIMVLLAAPPVFAADFRSGDTVTIPGGTEINDDLYLAGGNVTVDGTVNGDLFTAGGSTTVNGTVNGSIMTAGGNISITGAVERSVRAAGGNINASGRIGGDLLVAGGSVRTAGTSEIGRDLVLNAGNSRVDGAVGRSLIGNGGEMVIAGTIMGDVDVTVDRLTVASTARIMGNLNYTSSNDADIQSGASISGNVTRNAPEVRRPIRSLFFAGVVWNIISFLMILLIGIVLILVLPRFMRLMSNNIRYRPWISLGWGAIILVAIPIAAILVMITVIGIPLGIIALILYGIAIYLSQIPVGLFLGRLIIDYRGEHRGRGALIGALALGLVILALLGLVPILNIFVGLATALLGLGAFALSVTRTEVED